VLTQLKKDAQVITEESAVEIARCEEEIKSLSYAIANLELEHEIGQVDEETYKVAFSLLQESLKRATTEKTDYELTKSKITGILLGDASQNMPNMTSMPKTNKIYAEQVSNQAAQELPEPPVIVYVKEIGKAGI
jgi:hypothetical protein